MQDDILPFRSDETTVREGIGAVHTIISLAASEDTTDRCRICGYDRGERIHHTEVDGFVIECRQCERVLHDSVH